MSHRAQRRGAHCAMRSGVIVMILLFLALWAAAAGAQPGPAYDPTAELARIRAEIAAHGYGWEAGETELMRLPPAEREPWLGMPVPMGEWPPTADARELPIQARDLPAVWDWREHGGVTPAKNQGACSSCWAFAAVGALEAAVRIATGNVVDLSEQQAISCAPQGSGCLSGAPDYAFDLFAQRAAIREACLPYEADDEIPCDYDCLFTAYADGCALIPGDLDGVKAAVYQRPLVGAMHVYDDFVAYTGGCYEHAGNDACDHYVLIVGWDDTACDGAGAWICKNSWGRNWGIDGFFYARYGTCWLGTYANTVRYSENQPLFLYHEPLTDAEEPTEPLPVDCFLNARDAPLSPSALLLHYRFEGDPSWADVRLTRVPDGAPEAYRALLPLPPVPSAVEYWLSIADLQGHERTDPPGAPAETHDLYVHYYRDCLKDDVEGDGLNGWSLSADDDDALDGRWEKGRPEGTHLGGYPCNPTWDHTWDGYQCFSTGLLAGTGPMDNDVDGGKTTLITPQIETRWATGVRLEYYRWYSNGALPPPNDAWQVDLSDDDGATWVALEYATQDDPSWQLRRFELQDYIALTDSVRVRFVAADRAPVSIVEGAVDDIRIYATDWEHLPAATGARPPAPLRLAGLPNPTRGATTLRFMVPASGAGALLVCGPDGRCLRRMTFDQAGPGVGRILWDGRDDRGQRVPAGVYHLRLSAGGVSGSTRLIVLR